MDSPLPDEEWRPVVGYEGIYEVSSLGRLRSIDRKVKHKDGSFTFRKGRMLKQGVRDSGHCEVKLSRDCNPKTRLVHQLVCESFYGTKSPGMEVRHLNDVPTDNRVENLQWGSRSDNGYDRGRNGIDPQLNKTECPRGHPLEWPNLCEWQLVKGRRQCLACARAASYCRYHGTMESLKPVSDSYFRSIVETDGGLNG